jgi:hypothetical protein
MRGDRFDEGVRRFAPFVPHGAGAGAIGRQVAAPGLKPAVLARLDPAATLRAE